MTPITLAGFETVFDANDDPWRTLSSRDEAVKRRAVVRALGTRRLGRVLELGAGNGSNSVALARRALRLDATDGAPSAVDLIGRALTGEPTARALLLPLPARAPNPRYEAVIVAELLYYLSPAAMIEVAREVVRVLPCGGVLALAHHRVQFHDFAQHATGIHQRFLQATRSKWRVRNIAQTRRWAVMSCLRLENPS